MRKTYSLFLFATVILMLMVFSQTVTTQQSEKELTIYRDENCPCCKEYERYLRNMGVVFRTVIVDTKGLEAIRSKLGVPKSLYSCHSAKAGPYFIEGHVPYESISNLLATKPQFDGIAVPGMPSGSPGMGGAKTEQIKVYAKAGERIFVWMVW